MIDPYQTLGVEASASPQEIRRAYLAAAKANHPDHGGDAEAMGRINEAYAILSDPAKRRAWDSGTYNAQPDQSQAQLYGLIIGAFNAVLNGHSSDFELKHLDLISEVHALITKGRAGMKLEMKKKEKELRKQKMLLRRLSFKGSGANPLMGHLQQLIEQSIFQLKTWAQERLTMKQALELLKDYDFEFQPRQTPSDIWQQSVWRDLSQLQYQDRSNLFNNTI